MSEEPIRQATAEEILLLLRDRQTELRLLIGEPLATFSMPIEHYPRILVTLPYSPVQDDTPVFMTIDDRTVCVPMQLTDDHHPVPCGPWLDHQRHVAKLTDDIRSNDLAACLAVEITRRQRLEDLVRSYRDQLASLIDKLQPSRMYAAHLSD